MTGTAHLQPIKTPSIVDSLLTINFFNKSYSVFGDRMRSVFKAAAILKVLYIHVDNAHELLDLIDMLDICT